MVLLAYAEAHFDALMMAALTWAVCALSPGVRWAMTCCGCHWHQWVTLPVLGFFAGRQWFRSGLIALVVLLVFALFFWQSLPDR